MKIQINKTSNYLCEYTILRQGELVESISLDTKTYLTHDITHFVVEKKLSRSNGFWGMLASGYSFAELLGKENVQTAELRFIEKIVGPIQSVYQGFIPKEEFPVYTAHLEFELNEETLEECLEEIGEILKNWTNVEIGQSLVLTWNVVVNKHN